MNAPATPSELRGASVRLRAFGCDDVPEDIDWLCDAFDRAATRIEDLSRVVEAARGHHCGMARRHCELCAALARLDPKETP